MVAGTHLFYVVLYFTVKFVLQTGAMSVLLANYAKFELLMTPSQHEECFFSYRKEGVKHPDKTAYARFYTRLWENGMEVNADGIDDTREERNWTTLGRVLAPLYFEQKDWVPRISDHLHDLLMKHYKPPRQGIQFFFIVNKFLSPLSRFLIEC